MSSGCFASYSSNWAGAERSCPYVIGTDIVTIRPMSNKRFMALSLLSVQLLPGASGADRPPRRVRVFSVAIIATVPYSIAASELPRPFLSDQYSLIGVRLLRRQTNLPSLISPCWRER
jgi:hypothetical protein